MGCGEPWGDRHWQCAPTTSTHTAGYIHTPQRRLHSLFASRQPAHISAQPQSTQPTRVYTARPHSHTATASTQPVHSSTKPLPHREVLDKLRHREGGAALVPFRDGGAAPGVARLTVLRLKLHGFLFPPPCEASRGLREPGGAGAAPELEASPAGGGGTWVGGVARAGGGAWAGARPGLGVLSRIGVGTQPGGDPPTLSHQPPQPPLPTSCLPLPLRT